MEKFIIEGGIPLKGDFTPSGNKNAALPLLAACILTDEPVTLKKYAPYFGCSRDEKADGKSWCEDRYYRQ